MHAVILVAFATRTVARFDGSHHKMYGANPSYMSQIPTRPSLQSNPAAIHKFPVPNSMPQRIDGGYQKTFGAHAVHSSTMSPVSRDSARSSQSVVGRDRRVEGAPNLPATNPKPVSPNPDETLAPRPKSPANRNGGFHKTSYAAFGAKATKPSPVSSGSDAQTSWLPEPKSSEPQKPATQNIVDDATATAKMDGGYQKAYAAFGAKATDPSPVAPVSDVHTSRLPEPKSPEPQKPARQKWQSMNDDAMATPKKDGGYQKAYAAFGAKATNPSPVAPVSDVHTSWLPEPKSPESQKPDRQKWQSMNDDAMATPKKDGGYQKAYAAFGAKATNPSPVASVSDVHTSRLPEPKSPEPQKPARQNMIDDAMATPKMDGGYQKAYAAYGAKATSPSSESSVSDVQTSWLPEPKSPERKNPVGQEIFGDAKAMAKMDSPEFGSKATNLSPAASVSDVQTSRLPGPKSPANMDGGFHKKRNAVDGAKDTTPTPVSSVSDTQTSWLPEPKSSEPQKPATQNIVNDARATTKVDGGYQKAFGASGAKATNPSPMSSGSEIQIPWLPEPKSSEPQKPATQNIVGDATATAKKDGGYQKAYAADDAQATNLSPVSSGPDVQNPSLPESKPDFQKRKMDGGFNKAFAAYGAKSTNPNSGSLNSDVQAPWLPEPKSPAPLGDDARAKMSGGYHKAYAAYGAKAATVSRVSSGSDVQTPWRPEPKTKLKFPEAAKMGEGYKKAYAAYGTKAANLNAQTPPPPKPKSPEPLGAAKAPAKMDDGYHKANAAYGVKATNPSPVPLVSDEPKSQEPIGDAKTPAKMDDAKIPVKTLVSSSSDAQTPQPLKPKSPEPQYPALQDESLIYPEVLRVRLRQEQNKAIPKTYAAQGATATTPSSVTPVSTPSAFYTPLAIPKKYVAKGATATIPSSVTPVSTPPKMDMPLSEAWDSTEQSIPVDAEANERLKNALWESYWKDFTAKATVMGDENARIRNQLERALGSSKSTVHAAPNLAAVEPCSKYFIPGLFVVASFTLAWAGLRKFHTLRKPAQELFLNAQIA